MGTLDPMNANEMLDFALGQIDAPEGERFEREAATDSALRQRLERLDRAVRTLLDDGGPDAYPVPRDLLAKTLKLTKEHAAKRRSILDFVPRRLPFRAADVAVAAGVLLAGMLTLVPAVHRTREQMNQAGCTSNLQHLGRSLWLYGARHQHYPFGPEMDPNAPAGVFAVVLREENLLPDRSLLDCPCNGPCPSTAPLPRIRELLRISQADPSRYSDVIQSEYAYNVSHVGPNGEVRPIPTNLASVIPLLADQPSHERHRKILPGNSPNHGGRGQNVLYSDLHVHWHNSRRVGPRDADLFLNDQKSLGPGLHAQDFVLCPALAPCAGTSSR